jgi:hypothetical protein
MQEQKTMQMFRGLAKSAQKGTVDADVGQCCKEEKEARSIKHPYPNMNREPAENAEHIYMRIFGEAS